MASPMCAVRGCCCKACWVLMPGFDSGRESYLCREHWLQLYQMSRIQADCYMRLAA